MAIGHLEFEAAQVSGAVSMDAPESWCRWGSAAVSDALRNCKKSFQTMEGAIKPISHAMRLAGPAYTVRCYPGATWALEQAIEKASPGDVLVVDGGGSTDVILMGGLMSTRAYKRGIAGVVVDGAVRDIEDIIKLGFPVFSRGTCARAGTFAEIGELQTTVCCGRIPIEPGAWIVADCNGIAVVPKDIMSDVALAAEKIFVHEQRMARSMHEGVSLQEANQKAQKMSSSSNGTTSSSS